jgi:Fe2+ transport system protein FeoA
MNLRFSDLKPGDTARVLRYEDGDPGYRQKLMSIGITPGIEFEVIRRAPLGDPVEIRLRGYCLGLRAEEARCLVVEKLVPAV